MKKKETAPAPPAEKPVEGEDFYLENGLFVFTEKYLRARGFCCGSGCRHCPFGFLKAEAETPSGQFIQT